METTFSNNISQLVTNNLTFAKTPGAEEVGPKVNWLDIILLTIMFMGVNNCYWLTLYNVTNLGGNKLVNGLILGTSELLSGIFAGVLISHTSPAFAFQCCGIIGIVFNAINQFMIPPGTLLSYLSLFVAILGVGGVYTVLYVLIGFVVP